MNQVLVWLEGSNIPSRIISGGLSKSMGVFVATNEDIYVDNSYNNQRVDKWTMNATIGVPVISVTSRCFSLFIDINNTLYCSIDLNCTVIKASLDNTSNTMTIAADHGN